MAHYLVTGGAGFIGSHLVTGLVARGHRVRVLDNLSTGLRENLAHVGAGERGSGAQVELWVADLADTDAVAPPAPESRGCSTRLRRCPCPRAWRSRCAPTRST
ncbi:MAG: GDP-mannose 4,6-dehydratase [Planctomycetota bacterium]